MLLERAAELANGIKNYSLASELAKESTAFTTRANQLVGPVDDLLRLRKLAREFSESGVAIKFDLNSYQSVAEKAKELHAAFRSNPKSLLGSDESMRHQFLPGIRLLIQQYKSALEDGWRKKVDDQIEALPSDVLSALSTISKYQGQIQVIRNCDEAALRLRSALPADGQVASKISELNLAARQKEEAWKTLKGSELPDELLDFLKQAGAGGFSLAAFKPSIQQWLSERGLLSSFRIRSI